MLQSWIPNTLPLPYAAAVAVQAASAEPVAGEIIQPSPPMPIIEQQIDENDMFPKGKVSKFFPYQGYGYIITRSGKEIYFNFEEADMVGPKGQADLQTGCVVGYDMSYTSHGLRVKKMKIY